MPARDASVRPPLTPSCSWTASADDRLETQSACTSCTRSMSACMAQAHACMSTTRSGVAAAGRTRACMRQYRSRMICACMLLYRQTRTRAHTLTLLLTLQERLPDELPQRGPSVHERLCCVCGCACVARRRACVLVVREQNFCSLTGLNHDTRT